MSILLRGNPSLDAHMAHSQAINFGLITGAIQLVGMLVVVTIQALMITAKWDALTAMLGMALPAALLNGLLDCLLVPPLTLGIRHYTECFTEKKE